MYIREFRIPPATVFLGKTDEASVLRNPLKLLQRSRKEWPLAWVTDDLVVSALPEEPHLKDLAEAGITAVVDLREDWERTSAYVTSAFRYVRLPVAEGEAPSLDDLDWISGWIASTISGGSRVLVHCKEGRGRSPMAACAALMKLGFSPHHALGLVSRAIPDTELSQTQRRVLEDYAERIQRSNVHGA